MKREGGRRAIHQNKRDQPAQSEGGDRVCKRIMISESLFDPPPTLNSDKIVRGTTCEPAFLLPSIIAKFGAGSLARSLGGGNLST